MSGPQRKPTELGLLSGSTRAKARAKSEPALGFAVPEMPSNLTERAKECWPLVIEAVEKLRCVTEADALQLGVFAQALADYEDASRLVEERGVYAVSEKGIEYYAPWANRQSASYKILQNCFDRFGLNPSNRSKVTQLSPKLGEIVSTLPAKQSRYADE